MTDDIYYSEFNSLHLYDGLEEEPCAGEQLLVPGPAGDIEVLTSCPECYQGTNPLVIVCHPHPLYGGSLSNKVVHILSESFNDMGLFSITFNFRGVGRSQGRFDNGVGETEDLLAVVRWFRERRPEAPLWLAGFSFGAEGAAGGDREAGAERLLLVAPPVNLFDFSQVPPVDIPWMVIQGGKDDIVPSQEVSTWVHRQRKRPDYRWMANADHFFHGRMNRLRETLIGAWGEAGAVESGK